MITIMVYGHGRVGRNVTVSHCYGQRYKNDTSGQPEFVDYVIDIYGTYVPERATRFARRLTGDKTIVINNVETETGYYAMDLEEFMKFAKECN